MEHEGKVKALLDAQRWHMPRPHRQFLFMLSLQPSLRRFVVDNQTNKELVSAYNKCVEAMATFRNKHIIMVSRYILIQINKMKGEVGGAAEETGGSPLMVFLKSSRDETLKCLIK